MRSHRRRDRAAWWPLLLIAIPFLIRPELIGGDEPHYAAVAVSIAADFDFDPSNQYAESREGVRPSAGSRALGRPLDEHLVDKPAGRVSSHPIGMPLFAAPFLAIPWRLGIPGMPDLVLGLLTVLISFLGYRALSALAGEWLGEPRGGRVVAAITFFSTPLWFYSRTFFTEPWLAAALVGALWAVRHGRVVVAGLLLGAALMIKEQALLPSLFIVGWAIPRSGWRRALGLLPGLLLAGAGFVARNVLLYGSSWVDFPQHFRKGDVLDGIAGLAVDPARGIVWFAPVVLLGILLLPGLRKQSGALPAAACFAAFYLLQAAWIDWRGGSGFGPRLLVPVLPLLALPVALAWRERARTPWLRVALCLLAAAGIAVEVVAISNPFKAFWSPSLGALLFASASRGATGLGAAAIAFGLCWRATGPEAARSPVAP